MKRDLTDCTFIIPVKIDSVDRSQNFKFTINFLTRNFDTNVIVTEASENNTLFIKEDFKELISGNNITLIEKQNEKVFHRTKYLNEMLNLSKTKITVNYDIDVFLPIKSYIDAKNKIINDGYDLIYPFSRGWYQYMVPQKYRDFLLENNSSSLEIDKLIRYTSEVGHLQFFNTDSYKKGFGENEDFISYGPEDKERFYRFITLGYKVGHLEPDKYVFHLEHYRGKDSGHHDNYEQNEKLWDLLKTYDKVNLTNYYENQSNNVLRRKI